MNVDVDQLGIDVDEQKGDGEFSLHQGGVIALQKRVIDPLAFDRALIDEQMLLAAIGAAEGSDPTTSVKPEANRCSRNAPW